ncbi:MAG: hypothetical protein ACR2P8_12470, partial [Myxococcota bacterium]
MDRALWKDLALAALIGLLFGLSPHTSASRTTIKVAGGVLAGLAVLALRLWARRGRAASEAPAPTGASERLSPLA